jgi:TrpR-related protein YerC/YecD
MLKFNKVKQRRSKVPAMMKWGINMTVNPKLKDELTDRLFEAILLLDNVDECYQFFEDICTISELKALVQRLEVARMLKYGHTYDDIVDKTGASTATISRVKRCLNYGADGYKIILARVEETEKNNSARGNGV